MLGIAEMDMSCHRSESWIDAIAIASMTGPLIVIACAVMLIVWIAWDMWRGES
jgi:nucleoside permease NupC